MREARRKFQIEGGDQCHRGGGLKILGMGGDRSSWGGTTPGWGRVPPHPPPYWTTLLGMSSTQKVVAAVFGKSKCSNQIVFAFLLHNIKLITYSYMTVPPCQPGNHNTNIRPDGDNNSQATHGARKHAWRTQAAWAKN